MVGKKNHPLLPLSQIDFADTALSLVLLEKILEVTDVKHFYN